jgi:elongation factor P hydroxylase
MPQPIHRSDDLITLFNQTFSQSENTRLVCCEPEPIYRPADDHHPYHRIVFAHGFFASALHEIAHWCVAGKARRLKEDFGYWYQPDGRSPEQQALFEQVEVRPQAFEWIFSQAAGFRFHFSADNLEGGTGPSSAFKQNVWECVQTLLSEGLPSRAHRWTQVLADHYRQGCFPSRDQFTLPSDSVAE